MPKMKSHRGAAKRFRKTGSGRVMHQKKNKRHILTKMSSKRKRQLRRDGELTGADAKRIKDLIPYV
jgi:large subunit ribosomal protein L35